MKREELLIKMLRFHGIQSVMVEANYITIKDFYDKMITMQQELGVLKLEESYDHLIHPFVD